jgi:hypothetical protein
MSSIGTGSLTEQEIERLLCALEGIASARVSTDGYGRITAIHILAEAGFHPKQVVRNIESALSAGLGVTIDRRVVSVAQLQEGAEPPEGRPAPAASSNGNGAVSHPGGQSRGRLVFVSYDARTQPNRESLCRVTVRQHKEEFTGSATGGTTLLGRAQAAARALFSAITEGREQDNFVLDDVAIVSSFGRSFVLVAAHGRDGRELLPLTGVAQITRSPEEAAILAGLQAVNRWNGLED